jgi:hypothetical protein
MIIKGLTHPLSLQPYACTKSLAHCQLHHMEERAPTQLLVSRSNYFDICDITPFLWQISQVMALGNFG